MVMLAGSDLITHTRRPGRAGISDAVMQIMPNLPYPSEQNRQIALRAAKGYETYQAIGRDYGLDRESVRQIFCKAVRMAEWKINKPDQNRLFPECLDIGERAINAIKSSGMTEAEFIEAMRTRAFQRELFRTPNFGRVSFNKICAALDVQDLTGM